EQILDHAQPVGAEHARAIGTIHTVFACQEELVGRRFLTIAGDHPPRNLCGYSPTMSAGPFGMVVPDERVQALPVCLSSHWAEIKVAGVRSQRAIQHKLNSGRQL